MLKFKNQIVIWNSFKSKAGTLFAYHFICLSITDKPSQYMFNVSPRIVNLKDRPLNDVLKIDLSLSIHKSVKTDDLRKTIIEVSTTSIWPLLCLFPFFWQLNKWLLILHLRREIYYLHRFPSCIGAFKKLFCVSNLTQLHMAYMFIAFSCDIKLPSSLSHFDISVIKDNLGQPILRFWINTEGWNEWGRVHD